MTTTFKTSTISELNEQGVFASGKTFRNHFENNYIWLDIADGDYTGYFFFDTTEGTACVPTGSMQVIGDEEIYDVQARLVDEQYREFFKGFISPISKTIEFIKRLIKDSEKPLDVIETGLSYADIIRFAEEGKLKTTNIFEEEECNFHIALSPYKNKYIGAVIVELSNENILLPILFSKHERFYLDIQGITTIGHAEKGYLNKVVNEYLKEKDYIEHL